MRRILLLWPTVRPQTMIQTYDHWVKNSSGTEITIKIAVNTEEQREILRNFNEVLVLGNNRPGPTWATYCLTKDLVCEDNPIIILVSDDFYAPPGWDIYLQKEFENYDGAIHVNDGFMHTNVMTIPILTYNCLLKLNRIIYHPEYKWQYSDTELYYNLAELGLVAEKMSTEIIFQHKHYSHGFRAQDEHDVFGNNMSPLDAETFKRRMAIPIKERLCVS